MSYILVANVGTLINKYLPIVRQELKDVYLISNISQHECDVGDWFEWSFNHILESYYSHAVRGYRVSVLYKQIFNQIEQEYIKAFVECLGRNDNVLRNLSEQHTCKASLADETLVITTTYKIEL